MVHCMALSQGECILTWLNQLALTSLDVQTAAVAFDAVGIEELCDIHDVDEEVLDALQVQLVAAGASDEDAKHILEAVRAPDCVAKHRWTAKFRSPTDTTSAHHGCDDEKHALPYRSPMDAYFEGDNFCLPESPGDQRNTSVTSTVSDMSRCSTHPSASSTYTLPVLLMCSAHASHAVSAQCQRHRSYNEVVAPMCPVPDSLVNCVWSLSQEPTGSRKVQHAIEQATSNHERETIASELENHICEAAQCPHANHVLQKLIATMEAHSLQFMIDEISREGPETVNMLSQHRYGCRVLERLLAKCSSEQLLKIVASVLANAAHLSTHRYGNYVMQRLIEHSSWRPAVVRALEVNVTACCGSFFGSLVVGHALRQEPRGVQARLAWAIACNPNLLRQLSRFKHGPAVVEVVGKYVQESVCGCAQHQSIS